MKTKMNIRKTVKTSLTALALFLLSTSIPLQANDTNDTMVINSANQDAFNNLDKRIAKMELAVKFEAASVTDDRNAYEAIIAEENMEELTNSIEQTVRYVAPDVNEGAGDYELAVAFNRLDSLTMALEQSLKFSVPEENEIVLTSLARPDAMFFRFGRPAAQRISTTR